MAQVRVAVLRAPGTNCDEETRFAFTQAGAQADAVHVEELATQTKRLSDYQILVLPGGFSYGDDVAAGKLAANELTSRLRDALDRFVRANTLVIGICNGFQILVKSGLLPRGQVGGPPEVTLTWNESGRFEDRWVYLKPEFNVCVWTQGLDETVELPVAHGEGKFVPRDPSVLEQLVGFGQIVFHYVDSSEREAGYPWNPNGSVGNIAGICDPTGRIFGLMPHPERHLVPTHHPRWTRDSRKAEGDGLQIFRNGVRWAERHL